MTTFRAVNSLDSFNQTAYFDFWYGSDPATRQAAPKLLSTRQQLFVMSLISQLHPYFNSYEVEFPYQDLVLGHFLLKPKKRFSTFKSKDEVQTFIEVLKALPQQFQQYNLFPCVSNYFLLESNLQVLRRYFSIPGEKNFFERLKQVVPERQWQAYERDLAEKEFVNQTHERLAQWKLESAYQLREVLKPLTLPGELFNWCLTHFEHQQEDDTRLINSSQKEKLTELYYESLVLLLLCQPKYSIKPASHSDHFIDFLTSKEAKFLIEALEHLTDYLTPNLIVLTQEPFKVGIQFDQCVCEAFIELLTSLGLYLPHFKTLAQQLNPLCPSNSKLISVARRRQTKNTCEELKLKTLDYVWFPLFNGFSGFNCGGDELFFTLELHCRLIQTLKQNPTPFNLTEDLIAQWLSPQYLVSLTLMPNRSMIQQSEFKQLVLRCLQQLTEDFYIESARQARLQVILEEMNHLLATLPHAPVTLK